MSELTRLEPARTPSFPGAFVREGQPHHVKILAEEYGRRHARNARYSLRAFAKSISLHPSALSRIMAGKQTLALAACPKVLVALALPPPTQAAFLHSLVEERVRQMEVRLHKLMTCTEMVSSVAAEQSH